jgi:hypothetical protein
MADVAQLDLTTRGAEARLRALMEDVVEFHTDIYPQNRLALAVWYGHNGGEVQHLLELFSGLPNRDFVKTKFSLLWKTGSESPPLVEIRATSVDHFAGVLAADQSVIAEFLDRPKVLYFDKALLNESILRTFHIFTEPPHLMKGWYVEADRAKDKTIRELLSLYDGMKFHIGLVKKEESQDFENCRGLLHAEHDQVWVPVSLNGLKVYTFYNELQQGAPGFFLFRGGSLYRLLKFEEKTAPEYSNLVLRRLPDDRYPEVYLRAVHPPEQPAA